MADDVLVSAAAQLVRCWRDNAEQSPAVRVASLSYWVEKVRMALVDESIEMYARREKEQVSDG